MVAKTPSSKKGKGRKHQQDLVTDLVRVLGINEGDVLSTAMGQSGCDIYLSPAARAIFPFGVEAKRQESLSIPAWWRQCTVNAEKEGLTPLLVFRRNHEDALAVLRWDDLLVILELVSRGEIRGEPLELAEQLRERRVSA